MQSVICIMQPPLKKTADVNSFYRVYGYGMRLHLIKTQGTLYTAFLPCIHTQNSKQHTYNVLSETF